MQRWHDRVAWDDGAEGGRDGPRGGGHNALKSPDPFLHFRRGFVPAADLEVDDLSLSSSQLHPEHRRSAAAAVRGLCRGGRGGEGGGRGRPGGGGGGGNTGSAVAGAEVEVRGRSSQAGRYHGVMSEARAVDLDVYRVSRHALLASRVAAAAAAVVVVVSVAAVVAVVRSGAEKVKVAGFDLGARLRLLLWYPLFRGGHGS